MKKVFFFLALATGFASANAQGLSVTIAGSTTGAALNNPVATPAAPAAAPYNGFGVSCNNTLFGNVNDNGSISATVAGGAASHSYELYAGSTATGSPLATNATGTFSGLVGSNAGTAYTVKITDVGCPPVTAAPVNVTAPPTLSATIQQTLADNCQVNGGSATVTITGGVADYTFEYVSAANNGTFTGTPAIPVIATATPASSTTNTATGLSGNSTYAFKVTDANGCKVQ